MIRRRFVVGVFAVALVAGCGSRTGLLSGASDAGFTGGTGGLTGGTGGFTGGTGGLTGGTGGVTGGTGGVTGGTGGVTGGTGGITGGTGGITGGTGGITGGTGGTGGAPVEIGCSDGTREGFADPATYPKIAACSGGFSVPGILTTTTPTCNRVAGNTSPNPNGTGCSTEDLCALGFHVCLGAADVAAHSPTGCVGAAAGGSLFFAVRQSSTGCSVCAIGTNLDSTVCDGCSCAVGCAQTALTANDVFGCGTLGDTPWADCGVLDRFSNDLCGQLGAPWQCGSDGCNEANAVVKLSPLGGGVLCCTD